MNLRKLLKHYHEFTTPVEFVVDSYYPGDSHPKQIRGWEAVRLRCKCGEEVSRDRQ